MTAQTATEKRVFVRQALNQAIENYNLAYSRGDRANTQHWEQQVARLSRSLDRIA